MKNVQITKIVIWRRPATGATKVDIFPKLGNLGVGPPQALGVRMRGRKPSDYPPIKERSAYDRINVVEVRETSEPQEARRRERIQAEVKQEESP